jgi:hypothetical protein
MGHKGVDKFWSKPQFWERWPEMSTSKKGKVADAFGRE